MGRHGRKLLRRLDPWAAVRAGLSEVAEREDEYAGIPMPLDGMRLVVEPSYPQAAKLRQIDEATTPREAPVDRYAFRNEWWSPERQWQVYVLEEKATGRICHHVEPQMHVLRQTFNTSLAQDVWGIEQEAAALQLLGSLVKHRQFKQYMLTGMFAESSPRSGVMYLFRRLRPTVALSSATGEVKILAALCMHPIAYYEESWAGAMCPTDDVIAHLMLMRGDERMFWRRANQHPAHHPLAGL